MQLAEEVVILLIMFFFMENTTLVWDVLTLDPKDNFQSTPLSSNIIL